MNKKIKILNLLMILILFSIVLTSAMGMSYGNHMSSNNAKSHGVYNNNYRAMMYNGNYRHMAYNNHLNRDQLYGLSYNRLKMFNTFMM